MHGMHFAVKFLVIYHHICNETQSSVGYWNEWIRNRSLEKEEKKNAVSAVCLKHTASHHIAFLQLHLSTYQAKTNVYKWIEKFK